VARAARGSDNPAMPYVNVQVTRGATRDQKAALVHDITASLVRVLGKKPEHTHIVIQEIAEQDWGFSGLLTDEWRRRQGNRGTDDRGGS
jgi:4-oxalocrotonate tautomerase